jgi:hypothetical protein
VTPLQHAANIVLFTFKNSLYPAIRKIAYPSGEVILLSSAARFSAKKYTLYPALY